MQPRFTLKPMEQTTGHAPLAVLGYYWRQKGCFDPLERVQPSIKTVRHSPPAKLQDVLVSILAGYESLSAGIAGRPGIGQGVGERANCRLFWYLSHAGGVGPGRSSLVASSRDQHLSSDGICASSYVGHGAALA